MRVLVPGGFGKQLDRMHAWLLQHVGVRNFWWGSTTAGGAEVVALYFIDLAAARAFVDRFACAAVLAQGPEQAICPARAVAHHPYSGKAPSTWWGIAPTEGFETQDLLHAQALLATLG